MGQSDTKGAKEGWRDDGSLWTAPTPGRNVKDVVGRNNDPSCRRGMQQAIQPDS